MPVRGSGVPAEEEKADRCEAYLGTKDTMFSKLP
jgi:hypothetical protein